MNRSTENRIVQNAMARNVVTLLLVFGIVPLTAFSLLFLKVHYDVQKKNIKVIQNEIAQKISADLGGFLSKNTGRIQTVAGGIDPSDLDGGKLKAFANRIFAQGLEYNTVTIADLTGRVRYHVSRYLPAETSPSNGFKDGQAFKTAAQGMLYIGGVEVSTFTGFPRLHIALPLRSENGVTKAMLDVGTDFTRMSQVISEQGLGKDRYAYIVDRGGNLIAHPDLLKEHGKITDIPIVEMMAKGTYGVFEYTGLNNEKVIGASTIVPFTGWVVVVEQSVKTAYKDLNLLAGVLLAILLLTASAATFFGVRFSLNRIVRPVRRLREEAVFMSEGDFSRRIEITRSDELGELAEAFNVMAERVGESQAALIEEINERVEAEKSLRAEARERARVEAELEEAYEIISKGPAVAFLWKNEKGWPVEFVSRNVEELFGYTAEDFISGRVAYGETVHHDDLERVTQEVETSSAEPGRQAFTHEPYRLISKDGKTRWVDDRTTIRRDGKGEITHYQGIVMDITVRKQMEEEREKLETMLSHSQKMEAIGSLAGGIAHDFNNLLMGIQGNASLMLLDKETANPDHERLKHIEKYVRNGADLTRQLLGLARGGKYEVKPTNMNVLVKESSEMFGRTKKEIAIHAKFQDNVWTVEADQGQMEQVFLNLYVNAWQAMPAGGDLYLEVNNTRFEENQARQLGLEAGRYVRIVVTDTGVGMDEATLQRIFDPFFTTKEFGKGTGLGLASAYGIIRNHGGAITAQSRVGQGTRFEIYLPASEKTEVERKVTLEAAIREGKETVLLVDDEEMIIDTGEQMLSMMGYQVLLARGGKEAVSIYREKGEGIHLVILDLIMPDMGGGETYDALKKMDKDVKVLLSSGYSVDGRATELLNRGCSGFIQKPFDMKKLSQKMREILDEE